MGAIELEDLMRSRLMETESGWEFHKFYLMAREKYLKKGWKFQNNSPKIPEFFRHLLKKIM